MKNITLLLSTISLIFIIIWNYYHSKTPIKTNQNLFQKKKKKKNEIKFKKYENEYFKTIEEIYKIKF